MTPKEKALELVQKFRKEFDWVDYDDYVDFYRGIKQCALFAVDEILVAITFNMHDEEAYNEADEFWEKVKKEIKKL